MARVLKHRGPDGEGYFSNEQVHLASLRLAIVDVPGGQQPVFNENRTVVAVFNGEIYNYRELADSLRAEGHRLASRSDTEIIPHLYEEYGPDFVTRLEGIYAIALYDQVRRSFFLYRDPMGVKPLFYTSLDKHLSFASEAKAFIAAGIVRPELDPTALHLFMNLRFIPGCRTLFDGVKQLDPGHVLEWSAEGYRIREFQDPCREHITDLSAGSTGEIRDLLRSAVLRQTTGEVPMGVALSGGVDSSAVTAFISERGTPKTYTLGFGETTDELPFSQVVAEHFETEHHVRVLKDNALGNFRRAIYYNELPKVNCLQGYSLYGYMAEHVKVAFSGLGGDELFCGYDIFDYLCRFQSWQRRYGNTSLKAAGVLLHGLARGPGRLRGLRNDLLERQALFFARAESLLDRYLLLRNGWDNDLIPLRRIYTDAFAGRVEGSCSDVLGEYFGRDGYLEDVVRAEFKQKMVNDFLWNEDRMSSAHSLEVRVPFLDLSLVRHALGISVADKMAAGKKSLLKQALEGVVPRDNLYRPKWGFTFDSVAQFRKDLGDTARSVLTRDKVEARGIFRWEFVQSILESKPHPHLRWHYFMLWQMLGLEYWAQGFLDGGYFSSQQEGIHE